MTEHIGKQLGNYRLTQLLGRGGFADTYLGEQIYLKTFAAIKVLQAQLANDDQEAFYNEARTIARLRHPNIVRVLEFGVDGTIPYLVMDYATNGTLRRRHPRGIPLPPEVIVPYVKQVADALQYAHDQKLVHRDVKPENMLLGANMEVLLSDFGIAIIAQNTRAQNLQDVAGTMTYMAPEQIQGKPRPASDQYALAVVIYEWLCGIVPFSGTYTEVAIQHERSTPIPLRERVPSVPPDVEKVVLTALAKDPQQRFGSVKAFANALEQATNMSRSSQQPSKAEDAQMYMLTEIASYQNTPPGFSGAQQPQAPQQPQTGYGYQGQTPSPYQNMPSASSQSAFNPQQTPSSGYPGSDPQNPWGTQPTPSGQQNSWGTQPTPSGQQNPYAPQSTPSGQQNPWGTQPTPSGPNPYGNQPTPSGPNPYGTQPAPSGSNLYGTPSSPQNYYGQTPSTGPQGPYGTQAVPPGSQGYAPLPTPSGASQNYAQTDAQSPYIPPQTSPERPKRRLPLGTTILIAVLAVLLIGGSGLIYYTTVFVPNQQHMQATSTAVSQVTGTANANATATGQVNATSTAQARATTTAIAQATVAAQATQTALQAIFTQASTGNPTVNDPLTTPDNYGWEQYSGKAGGGCSFTGGSYHSATPAGYFTTCFAKATNFADLAVQVEMTILSGHSGGMMFRCDNNGSGYYFRTSTDGTYIFQKISIDSTGTSSPTTLRSGTSSFLKTGGGLPNTLAVVAKGSNLYLYINGNYVDQVEDATYTAGQVGIYSDSDAGAAEASFRNMKVWKQ